MTVSPATSVLPAIDRAAAALDRAGDDDPRPRLSFFDDSRLAGERGGIDVRLGATDEGHRAQDLGWRR
jgi:hypothetical protein